MSNDKGECGHASQVTMNAATITPYASLPKYVVRTALRQAEQAAEAISNQIVKAERERDELVRKLCATAESIERLRNEHNYRTKHVRELLAVVSTP